MGGLAEQQTSLAPKEVTTHRVKVSPGQSSSLRVSLDTEVWFAVPTVGCSIPSLSRAVLFCCRKQTSPLKAREGRSRELISLWLKFLSTFSERAWPCASQEGSEARTAQGTTADPREGQAECAS